MKKHHITIGVVIIIIVGLLFWFRFLGLEKATQPTKVQPATEKTYIDKVFDDMSLRDKVASLFILHTPGTDTAKLASFVTKYQPGGLILMGDNIPSTTIQLSNLTKTLSTNKKLPLLIAIDEEGGTVKRLASDDFNGAMALRNLPVRATKNAFNSRSVLLSNAGINLNFGIIADVTSNPDSFIFPRALGTTVKASSSRVAAAVSGTKGITLSTLKHFPGHGETKANSHFSIPVATTTYSDWLNRVAIPFESGIKAGADAVMFGHLIYSSVDSLPASLSKKWHDIITSKLNFKGVSITDDMVMLQDSGDSNYDDPINNSIKAINAGNTLILFVTDHGGINSMINPDTLINGVVDAVKNDQIKSSLINKSVRKVLNLRSSLAS